MGSGAYLAAKSEREIFEADFARERDAVEYNESEAREVLSLSYQIKGLPAHEADQFVEHLAKDREQLVRALAHERLHTTEEGLSTPWISALSGAASTAVGALIPIIPFFFMGGSSGSARCRCHLPHRTFRSWCSQVADHDSLLVGERPRDDRHRRDRGARNLLHRRRARTSWRGITANRGR
jgi:hypothetical protein